jgi:hypothetical protein
MLIMAKPWILKLGKGKGQERKQSPVGKARRWAIFRSQTTGSKHGVTPKGRARPRWGQAMGSKSCGQRWERPKAVKARKKNAPLSHTQGEGLGGENPGS